MEIKLDSWGFLFESGLVDVYIQRPAIIFAVVLYVGLYARKMYLTNQKKKSVTTKTR